MAFSWLMLRLTAFQNKYKLEKYVDQVLTYYAVIHLELCNAY